MTEILSGRCLCGVVAIEAEGAPLEMGYCHCTSCRSWSGAPLVSFALWPAERVRVTQGAEWLGHYAKTDLSDRRFCTSCGGHLLIEHPRDGLTSVHASALPGLRFEPSVHLNYAETVLPLRDGLPKLRDMPKEAGGTGEQMPE